MYTHATRISRLWPPSDRGSFRRGPAHLRRRRDLAARGGSSVGADAASRGLLLDERIAAYHRQLDEADARSEDCGEAAEDPELAAKIEALVERQRNRKALQERLRESGEGQVSEIDADARLLSKHGKTVGGYNCQIAVDDKHKLVIAENVVQDGNDSNQLEPMMTKTIEATGNGRLIGLADGGYCSGAQLKSCEDKGIEVYVPAPKQAARRGKGERFDSDDFRYDAQDDTYVCPAGQRLVRGGSTTNKRKLYFVYRSTAAGCRGCSLSHRCLAKGKSSRSVQRWEHEHPWFSARCFGGSGVILSPESPQAVCRSR